MSFKMVPFESLDTVSYSHFILYRFRDNGRKSRFFSYPHTS